MKKLSYVTILFNMRRYGDHSLAMFGQSDDIDYSLYI